MDLVMVVITDVSNVTFAELIVPCAQGLIPLGASLPPERTNEQELRPDMVSVDEFPTGLAIRFLTTFASRSNP